MYSTKDLRAWAEIDLRALRENCKNIASAAGTELIAVVKADAYGHGAPRVARELERLGVKRFAVACADEVKELRGAGITGSILVLGHVAPSEAVELEGLDAAVCAHGYDQAKELSGAGTKIKVHLKLDTGMTRLGVACRCESDIVPAADELCRIASLPNIAVEGIFTHFASADEYGDDRDRLTGVEYTLRQAKLFGAETDELARRGVRPEVVHAANSAGLVRDEYKEVLRAARANASRPGIILYGGYPDSAENSPMKREIALSPVMTLKTRVADVRNVPAGTPVGYGRGFVTERDTRIAVLTVGYADGYLRAFGRGGSVYIEGRPANIIGRVCMDMCMADVTELADVRAGDEAVLFGHGGESVETVASRAGTINYEVVCGVTKRVPRVYVG